MYTQLDKSIRLRSMLDTHKLKIMIAIHIIQTVHRFGRHIFDGILRNLMELGIWNL